MEAVVRKQTATKEKESMATRKENARMATFGFSALEALAKAPESQPPVPQAATNVLLEPGRGD
jgi:phosphopantetheinyl transferase (holo-ACP synthase)